MPRIPQTVDLTGYEETVNKGASSGYAPLDGSSLVPTANLGTGVAGTRYLRGDQIWHSGVGGTDPNAIHDNTAGEISGVAEKVALVNADLLLIEDSAAGYIKKRVQIQNLPGGTDINAIHDNVAGEISGVVEKATPVGADVLLIEDSAAGYVKKRVQMTNMTGTDPNAIHDNVAGEISGIAAKAVPVATDILLIEDAGAGYVKKRVQVGNLPGGGGGTAQVLGHDFQIVWSSGTYICENASGTNVASDTVLDHLYSGCMLNHFPPSGFSVLLHLHGRHLLEDYPLQVRNLQLLEGLMYQTNIRADTNFNDHMIENEDQINGNWGATIRNLYLDGNGANQGGAGPYHGIYWRNPSFVRGVWNWTAGHVPDAVKIENVVVWTVKGNGIRLDGSGGSLMAKVNNVHIRYGSSTNYGMYIDDCSDGLFSNLELGGNQGGLHVNDGCTANHFTNIYILGGAYDAGLKIEGCNRDIFTNIRVDAQTEEGIRIINSSRLNFNGVQITDCGKGTDNTYAGISLEGDSDNNTISNALFVNWGEVNKMKWAIEETAGTCDWNIYYGINVEDAHSGIRMLGANSLPSAGNEHLINAAVTRV